MALTLDGSSPAKATGSAATVVSASFTAPANALLVAFVTANSPASTANTQTVTDSGGLTWTKVAEGPVVTSSEPGDVAVWKATTATSAARTVTTTQFATASRDCMLAVKVFTDTGGAPTAGASTITHSASGLPTAAVTTTAVNSWVWGVSSDWAQAGLGTAGTAQTLTDENNVAGQYTGHVWKQNATTPTATSVTMNLTAPAAEQYNEIAVEIKANTAAGGAAKPPLLINRIALIRASTR